MGKNVDLLENEGGASVESEKGGEKLTESKTIPNIEKEAKQARIFKGDQLRWDRKGQFLNKSMETSFRPNDPEFSHKRRTEKLKPQ